MDVLVGCVFGSSVGVVLLGAGVIGGVMDGVTGGFTMSSMRCRSANTRRMNCMSAFVGRYTA